MGTYKRVRIDANVQDDVAVAAIVEEMRKENFAHCWRKYCQDTKWWPEDHVATLSKKFPTVMFRVDLISNGIGGPSSFFLNGVGVDARNVLPKFVSRAAFDRGRKQEQRARLEAKKQREIAEKKRKLEEAKRLEAEAQRLRKEAV